MKPLLIGVAGRAGAGKDTVGGMIGHLLQKRDQRVAMLAFAGPLKTICQEVYAFTHAQMTEHHLKVAGDIRYPRPDGSYLSPREAMQLLGTQWARRCYPNTWADMGIRRAQYLMTDGHESHVVITDCRFINEAKAIRAAGGQVWRVRRKVADTPNPKRWEFWKKKFHQSETEMETSEFKALVNFTLFNDGTLDELESQVRMLIP